jgi:hypothetical protein
VPLDSTTLYVLNDWVREHNLVPKEKETWRTLRAKWTAQGISKKERDRLEAKNFCDILQCMPVCVMQNRGVYYRLRDDAPVGYRQARAFLQALPLHLRPSMATGKVNRSSRDSNAVAADAA